MTTGGHNEPSYAQDHLWSEGREAAVSPRTAARRLPSTTKQLLHPLKRAHLNGNLLTEFFFAFSRFEYALKRAGFVKPRIRNAEPNWDKFADSIERRYVLDDNAEHARAIHYLLSAPPKRQIVKDDGSLDWEELIRNNETDIRWLLLLVRRVRNNLFHGGKYPYTPVPEPARDTRLLESSLIILEACLEWNEEVRDWFLDDLS